MGATASFFLYLSWKNIKDQNAQSEKARAQLDAQIEELSVEKARKDEHLRRLSNDPEFLARVVRERLGYVAKGEEMLRFEDSNASDAPIDEFDKHDASDNKERSRIVPKFRIDMTGAAQESEEEVAESKPENGEPEPLAVATVQPARLIVVENPRVDKVKIRSYVSNSRVRTSQDAPKKIRFKLR